MALKNDITPPLLQDEQMSSLPPKHNMRPQNLIPSSLLIFTLLGGYDCGVGFSDKRATVFRMSSASHIRLALVALPASTSISASFIIFRRKGGHTRTRIVKKMRGVPICQNIDLSSSHASFGPNGKCGKGENERPHTPRQRGKQKK